MVTFKNQLVIFGGHDLGDYVNDVWASSDGRSWTQLTEHAEWSKRDAAQALVNN